MKPMIKYRGGKSKEIPHLMGYIPRFTGRYIEPFLGGGALFFHLQPRHAIINDINKKLMSFYDGVRNQYDTLRQELNVIERIYNINRNNFDNLKIAHPNEQVEDKNEDLYYTIRDMYNNKIEKTYSDALLYYFINKTAYSGMIRYNSLGDFNVPFGRYKNLNTQLVTKSHSLLLQQADIYNTDYSNIFNLCNSNDFMFLDPPYDCVFSDYGNIEYREGFNEDSHRKLANDFKNLPCMTLMVIGCTPLTEDLYRNNIVARYKKQYAVNIRNRFKSEATHILVANYTRRWDNIPDCNSNYEDSLELETSQVMLFESEAPYGNN